MDIHHKHTSKGDSGRVASTLCCSSQCILGSVDSNSVEKCRNAPMWFAEWAVKLRGRALWLAGSSLPYINNNSYNKIKTVTKRYLCTNQDSLSR